MGSIRYFYIWKTNEIESYFDEPNNAPTNDFRDFFRALGVIEGGDSGDGSGDSYSAKNGSYYGIYQIGKGVLTDEKFFSTDGKNLNVKTMDDFGRNPIAQEIAALKEFSGLESGCSSKYQAAKVELQRISTEVREDGTYYYNLNDYLGQTFEVRFSSGRTENIQITEASVSGAAHLIGQGSIAAMLNKVLSGEVIDVNDKRAADGNGIAFTAYMQLLAEYDISALIVATTKSE